MQNQTPDMLNSLPFTRDQFKQIKVMLETTIPFQEDNLKRAKASGMDVTQQTNDLANHKATLQKIYDAWKDKYPGV